MPGLLLSHHGPVTVAATATPAGRDSPIIPVDTSSGSTFSTALFRDGRANVNATAGASSHQREEQDEDRHRHHHRDGGDSDEGDRDDEDEDDDLFGDAGLDADTDFDFDVDMDRRPPSGHGDRPSSGSGSGGGSGKGKQSSAQRGQQQHRRGRSASQPIPQQPIAGPSRVRPRPSCISRDPIVVASVPSSTFVPPTIYIPRRPRLPSSFLPMVPSARGARKKDAMLTSGRSHDRCQTSTSGFCNTSLGPDQIACSRTRRGTAKKTPSRARCSPCSSSSNNIINSNSNISSQARQGMYQPAQALQVVVSRKCSSRRPSAGRRRTPS
ncbi:hypothetical protein GY45DRAFT_588922 [Cubamyces sp. BRFM 1775]|nr:hypothetical protein GY45DRAFT_588922 [Cubamyces sp. BRFM 1775]